MPAVCDGEVNILFTLSEIGAVSHDHCGHLAHQSAVYPPKLMNADSDRLYDG